MRRLTATTVAVLALGVPAASRAQVVDAGAVEVELDGRVQVQFNTTSVAEDDVARPGERPGEIAWSTFETRRVRATLEVAIDEWITGKVQPDFALGRLSLKDAWMNLAFDRRFQLRVGQFKKPFSLLELTSSTVFPTIERGVRIRGLVDAFRVAVARDARPVISDFDGDLVLGEEHELLDALGYLGRDIGAAVHGTLGPVGYAVGLFNGAGPDRRDDGDGKSFAARLEYAPSEALPLVLGAAASYRELHFDGRLNRVRVRDDLDGLAFEVDAGWGAFRRPGVRALVEAAVGDNYVGGVRARASASDEPVGETGLLEDRFMAAQGIVAYFCPLAGDRLEGIEPVARVSLADPNPDRGGNHGVLLTPGLTLYFHGRNRLMFNWDVFRPGGERFETEHALRAQVQLHF